MAYLREVHYNCQDKKTKLCDVPGENKHTVLRDAAISRDENTDSSLGKLII